MHSSERPRRAVLIGIDGANYEAIKPLVAAGRLPHLAALASRGAVFPNALPPYPTLTGSNWATIATGAWPGTHGVTDMSYHVTGEPVDHWHSGFTSDAVEAETLWEAVARGGGRAVTLKYTPKDSHWPIPTDARVELIRPDVSACSKTNKANKLYKTDTVTARLPSSRPAMTTSRNVTNMMVFS